MSKQLEATAASETQLLKEKKMLEELTKSLSSKLNQVEYANRNMAKEMRIIKDNCPFDPPRQGCHLLHS
jgi:hypothetical protein